MGYSDINILSTSNERFAPNYSNLVCEKLISQKLIRIAQKYKSLDRNIRYPYRRTESPFKSFFANFEFLESNRCHFCRKKAIPVINYVDILLAINVDQC